MDHTSDPNAVRYNLDPARTDLAIEFRDKPDGPHSADLARLLARVRWGPVEGRYLLVILEPGKRWRLAQMPAGRGTPITTFPEHEFTSLRDAEWHVFKLRWAALTGTKLEID